ncbi:peptide-methionine (S)-S-oxide reductase MsrA [Dyadobacter tibetensis]|uniref:peptide-methionine (S)-S-oxide reductase MsrA n=1 Tax=Dyadobacter tibetensis TaxID=1211851 RepID=UPI000A0498D6|nr:peptide-methionine (S)-S-oxide reductase MsrA [Dyadobacter tibetensis]
MIHTSKLLIFTFVLLLSVTAFSCAQSGKQKKDKATESVRAEDLADLSNAEVAIFGTGCFWCTEAVFETLDGVLKAESGYAGGSKANPTYEEVTTGLSGHAECARIYFDPNTISYGDLLEAFFRSHDPTSLNRQGNDVGPQYRSVIFYTSDEQKKLAEKAIKELNSSGAYDKPIVTQVQKAPTFYVAEDYHQNYFENNPDQGYCAFVIAPKLDKFRKVFKEKLKK